MKGLERSSEQYTYDVKEVEPAKPVHADQYIEQPHHFYASSFCTWKTNPDIREVISYLKTRGIGILITDHNVRETLDIIDRASIIHAGEVLFEGSPDEIVDDPEVRRVYLGDRFT